MILNPPLSQQEKQKKFYRSVKPHSEDGLMRDYVPLLGRQEVNDSTMFNNSLHQDHLSSPQQMETQTKKRGRKKESATAESPLKVKKMICKGRSPTCKQNSLPTKSSQTLDQESISKERASEPFWSARPKEWSQKLWLPTETGSAGSPSNSFPGCFKSMESNSWFSMKGWTMKEPASPEGRQNSQKTSLPSLMCSIVGSMVKESTVGKETQKVQKSRVKKKDKEIEIKEAKEISPKVKYVANKCRRLRLFPSQETKHMIKKWFGSVRKTYNWTLATAKEEGFMPTNVISLRKRFINADSIPGDMRYLLDTPKHIRDGALDDLTNAYKSNMKKRETNPDHKFDVKFRSRKDEQAIVIPNASIRMILADHDLAMYPTYIKSRIKFHVRPRDARLQGDGTRIPLQETYEYECRMVMDKLGRFYLCIPFYVPAGDNQISNKERFEWGSLDPGVRTFQTIYSPKYGVAFKIGDKDISRIYRLCIHLDRLISRHASVSGNKLRLRRGIERIRLRIRHLVDEVHWKAIHFLVNNFMNIIIPPFEVQNMVSKKGVQRKIRKETVRKMLGWSHYRFRMRLMQKAPLHDTKVYVCGEEYTSKTCTSCMQIHHTLGGRKMFNCPHCGVKVDRDLVGSRNIFLKNILLETPSVCNH